MDNVIWRPQPGPQTAFCQRTEFEVLYGGAKGGGKALALDTPLPIPNGWTTMCDVAVGDTLFDRHGKPCTVLARTDVMTDRPCYRLTFSDGSEIVADGQHRWLTQTLTERANNVHRTDEFRERRRRIRPSRSTGKRPDLAAANKERAYAYLEPIDGNLHTTEEIAATLERRDSAKNHAVPVAGPLDLPARDLQLDPYILGLWLGDGTSANGNMTITEPEIVQAFADSGFRTRISGNTITRSPCHIVYGLATLLRQAGVLGNKHIPSVYLRASTEQRLSLLQGLMDTDGYASPEDGGCEFTTTSKALRDGVTELLLTLGVKAVAHEGRATLYGKDCGPKWRILFFTDLPVFRLPRKVAAQKRDNFRGSHARHYIVAVEPVPSVPVRCIQVSSPDGTFLAGREMIPTHNSEVLLMEGLRQIDNPRYHAGFFRRTYPQLQEMMDRAAAIFPNLRTPGRWHGAEHRWTFPSGARYDFRHLQEENDKLNYQGAEFHYLAFDQLEQFTESMYDYMLMQVRTSDPTIRTYVRSSANPGGIGHGWVKGRWIDDKQPYRTYTREFKLPDGKQPLVLSSCYIPAKVYDNKILLDANPLYLAQLMALPDELRSAMLEGNWDVFAGQYYPEFNQRIHVVDEFPGGIPAWWRRFRSLDYGLDMTSCHWWAVGPDGRCYIYRELYTPNLNLTQAAEAICDATPGDEDMRYTVASPDLWNRRQETGVPGEEIMRKAGLKGLTKADNNRVPGWRVLREYLAPFPGEQGESTAKLLIFRGKAPNLVRTLPTLIHDDHDVEDVAAECEDHAAEDVRYGVMSRPRTVREPASELQLGGTYTVIELRHKHGMSDGAIRRLMRQGGYRIVGKL